MKKCRLFFMLLILVSSAFPSWAQQTVQVSGHVTDDSGESLLGVTILEKNTGNGTVTDLDGNFILQVNENSILQFSFIGYSSYEITITQTETIDVVLKSSNIGMDEVVVIGYGSVKKGDLTGAVESVSSDDFNSGLVSSPAELINGKLSGVQIMSSSGSPTSGSTIRIRGGASLNASNDPLIVLDGVPLESGGISGNSGNFLSLINPSDIESMTVLKDASSTAIYGSRASNGVIIIKTKKGSSTKSGRPRISFSTSNSIQLKSNMPDMLAYEDFISVVNTQGSEMQKSLLGNDNTNWNDEIFSAAFGTDNNLSLAGKYRALPYRFSIGYYNQDGILDTDNAQRATSNLSLSPSFFQDHLNVNVNIKAALNKNRFAQSSAIWGAATYNPTIPVYSETEHFGGYNEAIDNAGVPVTGAVLNPVGLLNQNESTSEVGRLISNFDIDYKMHFLPELRFHLTLGRDYSEGKGEVYVSEDAAQYYTSGGRNYSYGPEKLINRLLTSYVNYKKTFSTINSELDATVGYDDQYWESTGVAYEEFNVGGETQASFAPWDSRHSLVSFYGRLNYTIASEYMLTATVRQDGTSRFNEDNRWGMFPSVALAWRLSEASFLQNCDVLSNLKLRASFGITGQQDGIGNYNYIPIYTIGQPGAEYRFGDTYYNTYRPEAYVSDLKWETTESFNYGIDYGFIDNRISGSVEYYNRKTKDLLASVPTAAGTNFDKNVLTNVGNVESQGLEVSVNLVPIDTKDITWDVNFNASWQKQKVTNLSLNESDQITNTPAGPTIDSYTFQVLSEGYEPYMFYVYHQLYDQSGQPIEGAYADLNKDGQINSEDLYRYNSPTPDYILGFNTMVQYKKWSISSSLRAQVGNYVYNGMAMSPGASNTMSYNDYQLNNLHTSYLETGFQSRQYLSDYYVENASFLKMDNLTLGYNFGKINDNISLNLSAVVQNVFTVTQYSGVDPEVPNGMDNSFYPRPRIFSLSIGVEL